MILVLVGYLTFFFDIENFTDRVMVVLTTMLVVATITSTIQAVNIILLKCRKSVAEFYYRFL